MHGHSSNLISYAIGGAIFLAVLGFRLRRMMQSRPFRLQYIWILPAVFLVLTALTLWGHPPRPREWLWLTASFIVGGGLGWFRAKTIRLMVHPETQEVMAQASPFAMVFILAIFAIRLALRSLLMAQSSALGVSISMVDSAFLAMACGLFVARAVEMGLRASVLLRQGPAVSAAA